MWPSSGFSFVLMNTVEEGEKETECFVLLADTRLKQQCFPGDELGSGQWLHSAVSHSVMQKSIRVAC